MRDIHLKALSWIWQTQEFLINVFASVPFWNELQRAAAFILTPIYVISEKLMEKLPFLKQLDWVLEIGTIRNRPAILVILVLATAFWKGLATTPLGHIATDTSVYPLLAFVSVYHPFLAVLSAVSFGIGDFIQKLFNNDIFLADDYTLNHFSALIGYLIAYSSIVLMGLLPGILSRVARKGTRLFITGTETAEAVPDEVTNKAFLEWLMGVIAAAFGGWYVMHEIAPTLEKPAFVMRPDPDYSCYHSEVDILDNGAAKGAAGGAAGNLTKRKRRIF